MSHRHGDERRPIGVILVGCGYIAQAEHIPGWAQEPTAGITAVVDRDGSVAAEVGADLGVPAFTALRPALAQIDGTAVDVCTPAAAHRDVVAEALAAGRHVLVEKPLTTDSASARQLCDDADRAGVTLMVAAPRLYDPYVAYVTDALDHGRLGAISLISTVWRMSLPAVYRRLTAQPRHRAVTTRPGSVEWLAQRLCDESIHHLGVVARWTAGPLRPQSVALTERAFQITLHADDVVVTHSNVTPSGHGETFTVYGEGGRMEAAAWSPHFPHVGGRVTAESAGDGQVTHPAIARANPYWLQIREFVDVIRGVRAPRRVARAAVDDLATIEAVIGHAATALASTTVEGRA